MKKYIAATLISITVLATLTGCNEGDVGKDKATQIALEDAGLAESDVSRLYVSKDKDGGKTIYEVQFTTENTEYDYEIQASDGDIITSDVKESKQNDSQTQQAQADEKTQTEQKDDTSKNDSSQSSDNSKGQSSTSSDVKLTEEEATKLALDRVPGATEQNLWIKLDFDDGYYQYEGEIIYNQKEYEFEIDANTGTFLEWSEERR